MVEHGRRPIEIVSAERVRDELVKLLLAPHPRAGLELLVDTGLAAHVLPELPALQLEVDEHHRHKDVYEHSLTVLEQAIDLEGPPDGPRGVGARPRPGAAAGRAAARHRQAAPPAGSRTGGGVSFHHHEVVGAKLTAKRLKALRFDKDTIRAVARLVELHLRFHGYGEGQWTDSAVRRYVTDAGPLLPRLHRLTRSDCTTRNLRKAARLSRDLRRPRAADRAAAWSRRSWARSAPSSTATRSRRSSASGPGRCSAAPTSTCSRCASTRARSARTPPAERLLRVVGRAARVEGHRGGLTADGRLAALRGLPPY